MIPRMARFLSLALLAALCLATMASADSLVPRHAMGLMGVSVGETAGSKIGGQLGGLAGATAGYVLAKDSNTITRIGAGMLGTALGGALGRSIGGKLGKTATGGFFRSLIDGTPTSNGMSFGVSYHKAPMATMGWKF